MRMAGGASVALATASLPWPALAQEEELVPFLDAPAIPSGRGGTLRRPPDLESFLTPNDQFFAIQHYNVPKIDPATYRLRIGGLVEKPIEVTLAELQKRPRFEQVVGFECSGNNNARGNPLVGNARWVGTSVATLLRAAGLKRNGREVVFYSADTSREEVSHGGATAAVDQHFARALSTEEARRPEVMLAWEMNGEPLPVAHGAPVRLIVPGWYGVANVKWLDRIDVQDARFMGKYMAREYVSLRGADMAGEVVWNENSVSRIRLKSAIGRVTRRGGACHITGFALTDGTPLKAIEVKINDGPWRPATLWNDNTPYSWKLFTYMWANAPKGEHTVVSRAIDVHGEIQPAQADPSRRTRWENNEQHLRRISL